jgi:hypothetical protein
VSPAKQRATASPKLPSAGLPLAQCEFCRSPIVWAETFPNRNARTTEGREPKLVPIDPEPNATLGNLAVTKRAQGRPQVGEMTRNQAAGFRDRGGQLYVRHVKTCTKANEMRRDIKSRHTRR